MAIEKMFVHFNGTKEQFITKGGATTYANKIVFISGGTSGNTCIFAQGSYFGNFAELLAAINYVKGVNVGGQNYNAAQGGGYVAFTAADPSTVKVNAGHNGIEIGLTSAFITKVNDTATNLGTKDDAANKEGSAFARIANLAALVSDLTGGSTESVAGQIGKAIDALRTEIVGSLETADAKTLAAINDELDLLTSGVLRLEEQLAAIKINGKTIYESPNAKEITLAGTDIQVGTNNAEIDDSLTITEVLQLHEESINTLNGEGEGSVKKQVADAIAGVVNSAPEDFDTLKEVADYIASDKTNAAQISTDLSNIKKYSVNGKKFSEATDGAVTLAANEISYTPEANSVTSGKSNVQDALHTLDSATKTLQDTKIAGKQLKSGDITLSADDITYAHDPSGITGSTINAGNAIRALDRELSTLKSNAITSAEMAGDGGFSVAVANNKLTITTSIIDDAETVSDSAKDEKDLLSAYAVKTYVEAMLGWEQVTA